MMAAWGAIFTSDLRIGGRDEEHLVTMLSSSTGCATECPTECSTKCSALTECGVQLSRNVGLDFH